MIALLVPMLCVDVFAADYPVSNFTELQDAITQAADGDTITVNGDITLTDTIVIESKKNITIKGTGKISANSQVSVTDPAANPNVKNTLFAIKDSKVTFDGLTLDGAKKNRVIYSENSNITLTDAKVINGCPGDKANINPGGGVFLRGGSLTATNTDFIGNTPGTNQNLPEGDRDKNGGAIYVGSDSTDITIEGGSFVGNTVPAFGHGAAIYQNAGKLNINTDTTKNNKTTFTENTGYKSLGDAGTQGVSIHTREGVVADINNVEATIVPGFNTGGFLRSLGGTLTIKNSNFTIDSNKGEIGIAGGVIASQNSNLTVEKSNFKAGDGSRVAEAGGLIEIVGTGTFNLTESTLEGAGASWNAGKYTANTGGAISFYDGSSVTANITDTKILNIMADGNGAGIALSKGNGHKSSVNLTLKNTTIQNAAVYTWQGNSYGGCMYIGEGNTVKIDGGTISGQTTSNVAAGIYNMGDLEITGGAQITGNTGYQMVGGIYHGGTRLKIDEASFSKNNKSGNDNIGFDHIIDKKEKTGINIYADADVIITPKATFDDNDVRVFDGQSSILLTGKLTKKINVSISEEKKTTKSTNANIKVFEEDKHRKVGYVVAKGEGYTPTSEDAKKLHYVTNDTSQAVAGVDDHESLGTWDFVLNPKTKQVVLGQRVKLTLHANGKTETPAKFENVKTGRNEDEGILTKLPSEDKKEDIYDVYASGSKSAILAPVPIRKGYEFTGWYKDSSVRDDAADKNKSGKTQVTDQKLVEGAGEITSIIDPNEYELYAGWEKVIVVEKVWDDNNDEYDNRPDQVTVKLLSAGRPIGSSIVLNAQNNWKAEFRDIKRPKVFKGYQVKEVPEQYTGYEKGVVSGDDINGFTITNSTEYTTVEGSKTWDHGENKGTLPTTVTVNLYEDGKATNQSQTGASWKFEKLPKYKNKNLVNYTLEEAPVDHYTSTKSADGYSFTNTFTNKYKVTYEFKPEDSSKSLPKGVIDQLPKEETDKANGTKVTPSKSTFNAVEENDGTWTFQSWNPTEHTINGSDVKFVGTWKFTPKKYKVTYKFESGTEDKELPKEVNDLLPTDSKEYDNNTTVTPETLTTKEVAVTGGKWKFKEWTPATATINKADVEFVGKWEFEADPPAPETKYKATYEFVSGTDGKTLPTDKEFTDLLPTDDTEYADKSTVTAKQPTQTSYEDTENNGTWTFTSWDADSKTVDGADVKFVGTWTFVAKPDPEQKSDFSITKSVDKTYYEKAGEVLTYTITVTNTGEADLKDLKLIDALVGVNEKTFELKKEKSKTFTYTYNISEADVTAKSVTNVASVTHGKITKEATATSILKEKEKRGDVYVRYETEDGKILDEFAVLIDAPVGTYYYTEEKVFPRYRFVGLAPYSDPAEGYVVEGTQYVVYLYRRDRGGRTPDRRDRYEREEKEVEEPIAEAKRKPELNKKDHKQYMYGYPDWTFVPAANITRGEAAAMFARLFKEYPGLDYNYKKYYTDVDESYWGFKEVAYLSEFGILSGYSDGTFRPNNKITRAELVKIVESFEALTWGLSPYNDVDGGHWAFRYIVSSAAKGWISGYPDGSFRPNSFISRAEAVTIVNRLLERRPDKDYIDTHKPELKPFTDLKPSYWAYYEIYEAVDGHDYNRSFTDLEEHWYRLNNERFVFSQPRYYR